MHTFTHSAWEAAPGSPNEHGMDSAMRGTPGIIAGRIREDIASGAIAGGASLNQVELAERFGVSRIPIREALRALEAEGLVRYAPNRGATVASFTTDDVRERYEMRLVLEPLALRLALTNLTDADLRRAKYELDEMRAAHGSPEWGKHHLAFHRALYEPARRPLLLNTIESLYFNIAQSVGRLKGDASRAHDAEHRAILAACKQGDAAAAGRALEAHLTATLERVLAAGGPRQPSRKGAGAGRESPSAG